jgi:hypothetical protein
MHFQEFDESQDMAGKPIPGFLCRVATPERKENLNMFIFFSFSFLLMFAN